MAVYEGGGTWKRVQIHRGGGREIEKWMKNLLLLLFLVYAIQPAQFRDPRQKSRYALKTGLQPNFPAPRVGTYLRRQSWFAAERKYQTCATQERMGLQLSKLDELG